MCSPSRPIARGGSGDQRAVADLIPDMHRSVDARSTAWQVALIAVGVATIALLQQLRAGH